MMFGAQGWIEVRNSSEEIHKKSGKLLGFHPIQSRAYIEDSNSLIYVRRITFRVN